MTDAQKLFLLILVNVYFLVGAFISGFVLSVMKVAISRNSSPAKTFRVLLSVLLAAAWPATGLFLRGYRITPKDRYLQGTRLVAKALYLDAMRRADCDEAEVLKAIVQPVARESAKRGDDHAAVCSALCDEVRDFEGSRNIAFARITAWAAGRLCPSPGQTEAVIEGMREIYGFAKKPQAHNHQQGPQKK